MPKGETRHGAAVAPARVSSARAVAQRRLGAASGRGNRAPLPREALT